MTHITRLFLIWRLIYNIEMHIVIDNIKALVKETGTKSWEWVAAEKD